MYPIIVEEFYNEPSLNMPANKGDTIESTIEIMNTRLFKMDCYKSTDLTGIAKKCDWFLHSDQIIKIQNTSTPKTIFLSNYKGYIAFPIFMEDVLPFLTSPFILIIASEDATFPTGCGEKRYNHFAQSQNDIKILLDNQNLIKIFVENLDTLHPKLIPLPLGGLTYCDGDVYPPDMLIQGPVDFSKKNDKCFCRHYTRDGDQWEYRRLVDTYCLKEWKNFVLYPDEDLTTGEFKQKLLESRFCICVHGGGHDPSPKAWYALLCGTIPIIEHSPLDAAYCRFPIVFVDRWTPDAITETKLSLWFEELRSYYEDPVKRQNVLNMLTIDYWWSEIMNQYVK